MPKKQTQFEQVPLETIKQIIGKDFRQRLQRKTSDKPNAKTSEEALVPEGDATSSGGR
jgi:hypothetical protein